MAVVASLLALGSALLLAEPIRWLSFSRDDLPVRQSQVSIPSSPELIEQGHQFFLMSCSHCHGDDAHGDEGPDLHNLAISNGRITTTIKKGVKGQMPSFVKKYDDAQVGALVAYLRTLR